MSAIGGVFHRDEAPVDPHDLEVMLQTQAPSGIDREGAWCDSRIALGQQTTVSLPALAQEPLPWRDAAANLTIAADVRLDNRDDLCTTLSIPPGQRETLSDRQLLLCAYQKWGVTVPTTCWAILPSSSGMPPSSACSAPAISRGCGLFITI